MENEGKRVPTDDGRNTFAGHDSVAREVDRSVWITQAVLHRERENEKPVAVNEKKGGRSASDHRLRRALTHYQ